VVHVLNLRHSNALADDCCAELHRGHSDDRLYVNELHRLDVEHPTADALDDHRNCVRDLDDHHHHVGDLDANRDHQNDHQTTDDPNLGDQMMDDQMMDDRDRQDDHHRCADAKDDLGDHRNGHVLVDDHHRCADATDDLNQNCARDLVGRHRHVDDLDANRDRQTCHQLLDVQNLDDPKTNDQMMDDRDRLDDHHRCADATDDLNQNFLDDLVGRQHCADATDDHRYSVDVTDGHRRGADGMVVNRHDEGLWLQRHLGVLDGLNHYLVLGDADRFCLV
jgi:hypothetical protein